jgi:hypothetical protein
MSDKIHFHDEEMYPAAQKAFVNSSSSGKRIREHISLL